MKVGVITSVDCGIASYMLPRLLEGQDGYEVTSVFWNRGEVKKNRKWWRRKLKKTWRIGVFGALLGVWMRSWYSGASMPFMGIQSLRDLHAQKDVQFDLYELPKLNGPDMRKAVETSGVELVISLGNGFIAPSVFSIPKHGMINVHHEQLPEFRNAQSVIWQLYEGNTTTGYSIHEISEEIDGGRILWRQNLPINMCSSLASTVTTTYSKLWEFSTEGMIHVLKHYQQLVSKAKPQSQLGGHYTTPSVRQFLRIYSNWKEFQASEKN